jgi:hypothetical protein
MQPAAPKDSKKAAKKEAKKEANQREGTGTSPLSISSSPLSTSAPPAPPRVSCAACESHHASNGHGLTGGWCEAALSNRSGKMWSLWGAVAWEKRPRDGAQSVACFNEGTPWLSHLDFEAALRGDGCARNFMEGTHPWPTFPLASAPALLGFDETIFAYCSAALGQDEGFSGDHYELARRCVASGSNVLRILGNIKPPWNMYMHMRPRLTVHALSIHRIPCTLLTAARARYGMRYRCLNLQWQVCAIHGALHGQGGRQMRFSIAPKELDVRVFEAPPGCMGDCAQHYAVTDVYYAEVCVFSFVCRNCDAPFEIDVDELFACELDPSAFRRLRQLVS